MQVVSRQPSETDPARIGPLDVLPVFLDVKGKRAVVVGGSDAAAWKAELLVAAGAGVTLFAPRGTLSAAMAALIARSAGILHRDEPCDEAALAGAALALADLGDDEAAAAFERACRRAGVPCNVIDRPAFCHFQFGTIVNRSPVVVGISTSGAAPILGQAIRRRIETLLPPSLADWAALARAFRDQVSARLPPGPLRRAFWERLVDRAFGPPPDAASAEALAAALGVGALPAAGHVTFVGAGPGDAELLTLKAVRALQAADVILYDDLVSDDVLELARREAKRILVGKRAGRPSCRQEEISALMLQLAQSGRRVVRLKSGDPSIFGRAGEEIEVLTGAGIGFDVVPGITAGVAMAAALGVSLTHRDHAKSVRFVTGHSRAGGLPEDVDWRAIADPSATTIVYMGGRTAGALADRLAAHGLDAATPVAVAVSIGRPEQAIRRATLATLAPEVADIAGDGPLIIGIGRAFAAASHHAARPAADDARKTEAMAASVA